MLTTLWSVHNLLKQHGFMKMPFRLNYHGKYIFDINTQRGLIYKQCSGGAYCGGCDVEFSFFWKKTAVITEEATFTHMVKRKLFRTPLIKLHGFVIKPWQSCLWTCFSCMHALWLLKFSTVRFMVACVELHPIPWATASELLYRAVLQV